MQDLVQQRCHRHYRREAVAHCLDCNRFFCRECVTEHGDRVLCSGCLEKQTRSELSRSTKATIVVRVAQFLCGSLTIWLVFYLLGHLLLSIPSTFHEGTIWKNTLGGN